MLRMLVNRFWDWTSNNCSIYPIWKRCKIVTLFCEIDNPKVEIVCNFVEILREVCEQLIDDRPAADRMANLRAARPQLTTNI